jgi:hypothetical protein
MKRVAGWALLVGIGAVACGGASADGVTGNDDELRSTEQGFSYACQAVGDHTLIEKAQTTVVVTSGHLRFDGDFGPNLGARDPGYKAPKGTSRVRYDGYETGDDCVLKVVADTALVSGQPSGEVRLQCAGDGFQQDLLRCSAPTPTKLRLPKPSAPPAPVTPVGPPASAPTWTCTNASPSELEASLTMQISDDAIRVVSGDLDYTGTRDRAYHPRSGSWIAYDDVGYGGDCSMTFVVDPGALAAGASRTTLKVRCAGDTF